MTETARGKPARVDLEEVQRLVDALENDLQKVREGSRSVETLRGEVEQLRSALAAAEPESEGVAESLHSLRERLHHVGEELGTDAMTLARYITHIGRILGL